MPTIRIDDEVYAWLQEQARAFEDTPNSVLRRVAEFDAPTNLAITVPEKGEKKASVASVGQKDFTNSGKKLNEKWNVGAKHALYHWEGNWFNNLKKFPGALFDPNGYVLFETDKAYRSSRHLQIAQETHVPNGIASIPGYVRMKEK